MKNVKTGKRRAVVFDVDAESLASIRKAFPDWEIEMIDEATVSSLTADWDPSRADLLVVGVCEDNTEMLGLCRFLAYCSSLTEDFRSETDSAAQEIHSEVARANAPLLVLVRPGQEALVQAALRAGADSCQVLPIHHKDIRNMLARAGESNQPGRHTLNLQQPQNENLWQDEGGEG